jgi:hypothetical protein
MSAYIFYSIKAYYMYTEGLIKKNQFLLQIQKYA